MTVPGENETGLFSGIERTQGSGCRVQGPGSRVQGPGFRVQGSGFPPGKQTLGVDNHGALGALGLEHVRVGLPQRLLAHPDHLWTCFLEDFY